MDHHVGAAFVTHDNTGRDKGQVGIFHSAEREGLGEDDDVEDLLSECKIGVTFHS